MEMNSLLSMSVLIGIIVGAVEVCKLAGFPNRFLPILDVIIGITLALILVPEVFATWKLALLGGAFMGLTAAGLYRSVKVIGEGK